jgi:hypothetical protein
LAVTPPILTKGVTGIYQQQQDFQRPHSFAGWLTNNELVFPVPHSNDNGPQQYVLGGIANDSSPISAVSTPFAMRASPSKVDMPFLEMGMRERPCKPAPQDVSQSCASVDSSNHMDASPAATHKVLATHLSQEADKTDFSDIVEGLSKEGLKALREARNREKNKR